MSALNIIFIISMGYYKNFVWPRNPSKTEKYVCSFGHILGSVPALWIFQHPSPYLLSLLIVVDYIHWTVESLYCIFFWFIFNVHYYIWRDKCLCLPVNSDIELDFAEAWQIAFCPSFSTYSLDSLWLGILHPSKISGIEQHQMFEDVLRIHSLAAIPQEGKYWADKVEVWFLDLLDKHFAILTRSVSLWTISIMS